MGENVLLLTNKIIEGMYPGLKFKAHDLFNQNLGISFGSSSDKYITSTITGNFPSMKIAGILLSCKCKQEL